MLMKIIYTIVSKLKKFIFVPFCFGVFFLGCKEGKVRVYRIPKENILEGNLQWSVPSGWKEQGASGVRLARFEAGTAKGSADVSVVMLPGSAGGILANINRWRGQVGLGPIDEKSLQSQLQRVPSSAGELSLVDFSGVNSQGDNSPVRMLAAILFDGETTWFFKTQGEPSVVIAVKPTFLEFLRSLRFAGK